MEPAPVQPGFRLDRYELLCPLAYGGMASVWLARFGGRLGFEKLVVVKMILPQYAQDSRFQQMFMDEARIASRIEHPNVARILDVGEHEGHYFIVMEWVDGDSVSKIMRALEARNERIPVGVGLRIGADAAAGLHAAHELKGHDGHELGVVHRDVSPQNILVSNTGAAMLIDFGVAKARDRVSQETSAGQLKGKVRYMAPEQAIGKEIDRRADIFSLGSVLYELFAGVPPFDGANEVAILHALTGGARPPPLPDHVPPAVAAVIMRALDHDVDQRYATALELSLSLESAITEVGETTTSAVVAAYCDRLLAERRAGRKRSVDAALAQARQRDAGDAPHGSLPRPPTPPPGGFVQPTSPPTAVTPHGATPGGGFPQPAGAPPAPESQPSAISLAESPSATSTATLGSAAIEWPPRSERSPKRKYVGAAAVGVLMAGILIAAAALVRTAVSSSSAASSPPANGAPTEVAPVASEAPAAPPPVVPDPPAVTAAPAASSKGPAPAATVTAPTTSPRATTPPPAIAAAPPKPTTAPAPPPKPTTRPTSTGTPRPAPTKKDYGF